MADVRRQGTERKQIRLTPTGRERIQAWADEQDVSFSAAIEGLALAGLEDELVNILLPLLLSMLSRIVNRTYNRLAKLMATAAIEAGLASQAGQALLLQQIRTFAEAEPQDFTRRMQVSREAPGLPRQIRQVHEQMLSHMRRQVVRQLKRPLAEIEELLADE